MESKEARVVLVQMPFAAIERPSIGLGLLAAALNKAGINTRIDYPNLDFAEQVGLSRYRLIELTRNDDLLGEWVFAPAAFGEERPEEGDFLERVDMSLVAKLHPSQAAIREAFAQLRQAALPWIERLARSLTSVPLLAVSSMFQQHCASLALLRRVKQLAPHVITMLGGANCEGVMGRATFEAFPWLDWVVCGEADEIIVEVMEAALSGSSRPLPEGVLRRGTPEPHRPRLPVTQLDALPTPEFSSYFERLGRSPLRASVVPGLLMEASRGCWWGQKHHCTFCGLNGSGMAFRAKSSPRVLQELSELTQRHGVAQFELTDNILATEHMRDLLPQLESQSYTLFAEVKANLRRPQVEALARAGVRWIQPGIESLHDEVLRLIDKGTSTAVNLQLLKWARQFGLFVSWNFLVGFPGERPEWYREVLSWLPLVAHLQPPQGVFRVRFDRFSPYHSHPERHNLRLRPHPAYSRLFPATPQHIADLAYFHIEEGQRWEPQLWQVERISPPLEELTHSTRQWNEAFWAHLPAILSMNDRGDRLEILDTRACAAARRHSLAEPLRSLYLACDTAQTLHTASTRCELEPPAAQAMLAQLCDSRLLLALPQGRYLALAVAGDLPRLLLPHQFPGGATTVSPAL